MPLETTLGQFIWLKKGIEHKTVATDNLNDL